MAAQVPTILSPTFSLEQEHAKNTEQMDMIIGIIPFDIEVEYEVKHNKPQCFLHIPRNGRKVER